MLNRRLARIATLLALLAAMPLAFGGAEGIRPNEACAEEGGADTCCIQLTAGCPGVGKGYYDKGCSGPCGEPCP